MCKNNLQVIAVSRHYKHLIICCEGEEIWANLRLGYLANGWIKILEILDTWSGGWGAQVTTFINLVTIGFQAACG